MSSLDFFFWGYGSWPPSPIRILSLCWDTAITQMVQFWSMTINQEAASIRNCDLWLHPNNNQRVEFDMQKLMLKCQASSKLDKAFWIYRIKWHYMRLVTRRLVHVGTLHSWYSSTACPVHRVHRQSKILSKSLNFGWIQLLSLQFRLPFHSFQIPFRVASHAQHHHVLPLQFQLSFLQKRKSRSKRFKSSRNKMFLLISVQGRFSRTRCRVLSLKAPYVILVSFKSASWILGPLLEVFRKKSTCTGRLDILCFGGKSSMVWI